MFLHQDFIEFLDQDYFVFKNSGQRFIVKEREVFASLDKEVITFTDTVTLICKFSSFSSLSIENLFLFGRIVFEGPTNPFFSDAEKLLENFSQHPDEQIEVVWSNIHYLSERKYILYILEQVRSYGKRSGPSKFSYLVKQYPFPLISQFIISALDSLFHSNLISRSIIKNIDPDSIPPISRQEFLFQRVPASSSGLFNQDDLV